MVISLRLGEVRDLPMVFPVYVSEWSEANNYLCLWAQDIPYHLELLPLWWRLGKLNYVPTASMRMLRSKQVKGQL